MEPEMPTAERSAEEKAAARRDSRETLDAFIIVMGVSFFPLIFASIGLLLIHFRVIYIADYDPTASTVKGLGRGLYMVTYFGVAGLVVPVLYGLFVFGRAARQDKRRNSRPK